MSSILCNITKARQLLCGTQAIEITHAFLFSYPRPASENAKRGWIKKIESFDDYAFIPIKKSAKRLPRVGKIYIIMHNAGNIQEHLQKCRGRQG